MESSSTVVVTNDVNLSLRMVRTLSMDDKSNKDCDKVTVLNSVTIADKDSVCILLATTVESLGIDVKLF